MQSQNLLLKCLILCCVLLMVQNFLQSLALNNGTSMSTVPTWSSLMNNLPSTSSVLAKASSQPQQGKLGFLLSVPFYVYEDLAWQGATYTARKSKKKKKVKDIANPRNVTDGRFKHGADYWLMQASLKGHPMRTYNMSDAKLFFVPWLMNFFDNKLYKNRNLCVKDVCNMALVLKSLDKLLESPAFQSQPDHHVIVRSSYASAYTNWNGRLVRDNPDFQRFLDAFKQMQVLVFENKDLFAYREGRHTFSAYHVGTPCPLFEGNEKPYDVAMIAALRQDRPAFKNRRKICKWLGEIDANTTATGIRIKTSVCGEGSQCPALAESKFGFHVAGDTYSSQRLMDTILSGTVPIFTHLHQYELAGSDWIDWSQLSYYLPVHNDTGKKKSKGGGGGGRTHTVTRHSLLPPADRQIFEQRLRAILNDKEGYERKHRAVLEHMPLFDYTTLYPFDTYMYLFQAELYPETRHPVEATRWSALKLPPPLFDHPTI